MRELTSQNSVASHFDAQVAANPTAVALRGKHETLSYQELNTRVASVAAVLQMMAVQPGEHVALFAARSIDAIVGMLACLRVGAVYVPMDPTFAPEQLNFIIEDVPFVCALAAHDYIDDAEGWFAEVDIPVIDISTCVAASHDLVVVDGNAPACILYTSGTTGRPKGVVVPHRAITSMAVDQPELALRPDDVVLSAATIACDGALAETLVPLISGASVALVEAATPEIHEVAETMIRHKVTVALWYAGLHHLMIAHRVDAFASVRISEQGGDVMSVPMAEKLLKAWPELRLFNGFGPTETCVRSILHEVTLEDVATGAIPIGTAMTAEDVVLLDDTLTPVKVGETGQIAIGGVGVALEYFQRPDATKRAFVPDPRDGKLGTLYLTGDLAMQDKDGVFHFAGRADRQVKMAGRRVEIDGVEHALRNVQGVEDAVVELVTAPQGGKSLTAYIVTDKPVDDEAAFVARLRRHTEDSLARDIFPRSVVILDAFPLTRAGKVDRKALRTSETTAVSPEQDNAPRDVFGVIAGIWQSILGGDAPKAKDTFFDLGGTSLQLIDAHAQIEKALDLRFPIADIFELPRLGDLADHLGKMTGQAAPTVDEPKERARGSGAIAIVGMAARLPGGVDFADFWDVIRDGRSLIETFDRDVAEDAFDAATRVSDAYVPARSLLRDVDMFDAKFFDMRPKEAAVTDPQGRVFLEICQEALDNAGIDPDRASGGIGVFAGAPMSTYMLQNLLSDRQKVQEFTSGFQIDYSILAGNDSSDLATRVAFKLGLKGPAMSVSTACSTSLVAIGQAVHALRSGEADAALAGGVSITFPQQRGYLYMESGMASSDGLCRPFDADASGTVFGHGAGVIVLKRLEDAERDGDHIHAVIRGVGLNNDGADKMSYTAPSVTGQANAIRAAHRDGGVDPAQIGYVECHGTGTPLGDPIEIAGLKAAFGPEGRCALGAVKGNLGHLDAAAGVMGVIKAAKVLGEKTIPPVAHFKRLNNRIDLSGSPFWVPDQVQDWKADGPRFAGISSFGVGGTNAHIVLEEAPAPAPSEADTVEGAQILPLSAKSPEALAQMAQDVAAELSGKDLGDAAFTLQDGRRAFDYRLTVAARDTETAIAAMQAAKAPTAPVRDGRGDLVFLLPGQGAQYPGMGSDLYDQEPTYRHWIDRGAEILTPILGQDMRPLLLGRDLSAEDAAAALRETRLTQPALYLTEYALGMLWAEKGIRPAAYIGHSVGEFAAAVLAGVMSFEDALRLIAARGQLMQDQPSGSMLSVRAPLDALTPHLDDTVDLAARNAPKLQVVAGPDDAIDALAARLEGAGIANQRLHTSHAFHSQMMDPVSLALFDLAEKIAFHAPQTPIYSTVLGKTLTTEKACDPAYWAAQARACVNFQGALEAAAQDLSPVFLELGPGRTLTTCAAQTLPRDVIRGAVQSLPDHTRPVPDDVAVAQAAGGLWSAGMDIDWSALGTRGSRKVELPSYAFQRQRCWIDAPDTPAATPTASLPVSSPLESPPMTQPAPAARLPRLKDELSAMLADMSGEDIGPGEYDVTFVELGFDSLFLGQVSQEIGKTYGVQIGFRKMLADISSISALAAHLDAEMPEEVAPAPQPTPVAAPAAQQATPVTVTPAALPTAQAADGLIHAQLQTMQAIFAQQLQALGQTPATATPAPLVPAPQPVPVKVDALIDSDAGKPEAFKFGRGPSVTGGTMSDAQVAFAKDLAQRYAAKHAKSKAYTAKHRNVLADPRTAAGFRSEWKELVFPIVAETSKGAYINDLDGNRFIDLVNGFGQTAFGHSPDFVIDAVNKQMAKGFPIGPQADAAGPVAQKFADAVGHERVTFCNTGSEAVMAAMRVARTVTGRDLIVVFDRDYHGQFDEVLIKGKASGKSADPLPIAPGIPRTGLKNMKILPYGGEAALTWIRENINDVAAVIVEPVQSRHPEHRPAEFVCDLRKVTKEGGAALVIDEVVTGFRTSARGMQGVWGIQGDMATYGKVVGGGMPIGVLAGDAVFMDALDGGGWQFGDDSTPEAVPTFFAGTFVRHPLVLAAVDATLDHMAAHGDDLWNDTAARTADVAAQLSQIMVDRGLPNLIETYSSWFVMNVTEADPRATLLYPLMRMEGVHVMDGFCCFLTTEHSEADCDKIVQAFEKALDTLLAADILTDLKSSTPKMSSQEIGSKSSKDVAPQPQLTDIPLTASQREIWMTHQLGGMAAAAFNESGSLDMRGDLNVAAVQTAWSQLIARHDALRLRFAKDGATFSVSDDPAPKLMQLDLSGDPNPQEALDEYIAEDGATPFDITTGSPIRGVIARLADDHSVLVLTAHHIVADGWSFGVMLADFADLYTAAITGKDADLPEPASFAAHALAEAKAGTTAETKTFWTEMLTPAPALPDLPSDRPRPEQRSFAGDTVFYEVDGDLVAQAKKAGAKAGCTLFATAFAAMQILVNRISGADDFALGVPTAAQQNLDNPELVGHCVNFLPIRVPFAEDATIASHLSVVRDRLNAALDHQDTTFGAIVQDLDLPRALNRLPLAEVEFNLEQDKPLEEMAGLTTSFHPNAKRAVNFDLFFNVVETTTGLRIEAHFNTDLFDAARVRGWAKAYQAVLSGIVANIDQPARQVSLLTRDEERALLASDVTVGNYDRTATLTDLIERSVAAHGAAPAITDAKGTITYSEMAARVDALAALIQSKVSGQGARVALCVPRGTDMVLGLLAILKAGHTYVPLDPNQPPARLRQIVETAEVTAVLTDHPATADFADGTNLMLMGDATTGATPAAVTIPPAAYVIFTSGSTGVPKGVTVPHRALVNFLTSMASQPGFSSSDNILAVTTVMFDIAALEMFLPLTVGGHVEIAPLEMVVDGFKLVDRLSKGDITMMQATPTLWDMALTAGFAPEEGFTILCGGEALPKDLANRLLSNGATVWNMYGPTETTIWSAIKQVQRDAPITIGAPIANTGLHILDSAGQLVPEGVVGELNISGDGLALGYYNRPELTKAAFRDVTLGGETRRLYATGDLAQRLPNGEITVLGRIDTQVKLRGFRIELGEIETRLRAQPGVAQAAVDLRKRDNGDGQLVGYVVADEDVTLDTSTLGTALAADLPDYMVPRAWVVLSALPQTGNGKLDRKSLPDPQTTASVTPLRQVVAAETPTEKRIAAIWEKVLEQDTISVTETLHALGVDSLAMFRIASHMLNDGLNLEAKHMFAHPSIRALADFYDGREASGPSIQRPSLKAYRGGARRGDETGGAA